MGAERLQDIVELYRFKEGDGTYSSSCVLKFDGDVVTVKGLSLGIDIQDWKELYSYLQSIGVSKAMYERFKGDNILLKEVMIKGA